MRRVASALGCHRLHVWAEADGTHLPHCGAPGLLAPGTHSRAEITPEISLKYNRVVRGMDAGGRRAGGAGAQGSQGAPGFFRGRGLWLTGRRPPCGSRAAVADHSLQAGVRGLPLGTMFTVFKDCSGGKREVTRVAPWDCDAALSLSGSPQKCRPLWGRPVRPPGSGVGAAGTQEPLPGSLCRP